MFTIKLLGGSGDGKTIKLKQWSLSRSFYIPIMAPIEAQIWKKGEIPDPESDRVIIREQEYRFTDYQYPDGSYAYEVVNERVDG